MLTITIDTSNAAFEADWTIEVTRILRELTVALTHGPINAGRGGKLRDINGNTVGAWRWELP